MTRNQSVDREVEIQVTLENVKPLLKFVKEKAKFISEEREIDQYFTPKHRDFAKGKVISEWLRLRNAEGKNDINYKFWHRDEDGKTNHCTEYQTRLEDIDQMKKILTVLDFKPVVTVDKKRTKYHYKNYEITIDKVKSLDQTVEIEFKGKTNKTPKQITEEMIKFLQDLGVGKMKRSYQGYAFLCLRPDKAEYEEIN